MESKILDKINTLKSLRNHSNRIYEVAHGTNKEKRYDKTSFDFSTKPAAHNLHEIIYFQNYNGIYGNSGVTSSFRSALAQYIALAIDEKKHQLFKRALELIDVDIKNNLGALKNERAEIDKTISAIENISIE